MQSAGIALTRKAPETALSLFPANGLAQEELATGALLAAPQGSVSESNGLSAAGEDALSAYQKEPLSPEAHAILAMAQRKPSLRAEIVTLASELNRRNPRLQAVILQEQVGQQDYPAAIATLDRLLRVRPSRSAELFPSLLPLFARDGADDEFARILDGTSPWHRSFFQFAVSEPAALPNLLALRKRMAFDDEELDKALLKNLAAEGEVGPAYGLYQRLGSAAKTGETARSLDWNSTFVPFEWEFTDRAGLRAQPSLSGEQLEILVKPGNGGVMAQRVIEAPKTPFVLQVLHDIGSSYALEDIDVVLNCLESDPSVVFDRDLASQNEGFEIEDLPSSCRFLQLAIEARAWSGRPAINVQIDEIRIRSQKR